MLLGLWSGVDERGGGGGGGTAPEVTDSGGEEGVWAGCPCDKGWTNDSCGWVIAVARGGGPDEASSVSGACEQDRASLNR